MDLLENIYQGGTEYYKCSVDIVAESYSVKNIISRCLLLLLNVGVNKSVST